MRRNGNRQRWERRKCKGKEVNKSTISRSKICSCGNKEQNGALEIQLSDEQSSIEKLNID